MKFSSKVMLCLPAVFWSLVLCAAEVPAQTKKYAYDKYQDWQFVPLTIKDADADNNVRNQMDFTVPVHGPWLLNPASDSITICWITREFCAAGIEYREKGTESWTRLWPVKYGQIDFTKDLHSFHLTGLKPNTEYEYRLLSNMNNDQTAYHMVTCVGREIYSFRTIDPDKKNFKAFFTADIHGSARLSLDPMYENSKSQDADFFFFLGDNVEDGHYLNPRYFITFGFLDDVCRIWGKSKPTVFIRGNHDSHGIYSIVFGDYFPRQDGKTYFAFKQGDVLFLCLDTIWPSKVKIAEEQNQKLRMEQIEWIRDLKKTDLWKKSKFRVAMGHVGPFASDGARSFMVPFEEEFKDASPDGRIHVFLCGHDHRYYRIDKGTKNAKTRKDADPKNFPPKYLSRVAIPDNEPYTLITVQMAGAMTMEASADKLVFKNHDHHYIGGGMLDSFEILPDGTVKDLMEVYSAPIPQPQPKNKKK